jgi:predicted adenine nucleotide alpha hydrolase (AANH) superfamily ATPase
MKILLHMCCAPCAVYPVKLFKEERLDFTGFFYNPNIHPLNEFILRKETLMDFSKKEKFPVVFLDDFDQESWEAYGENKAKRCLMCYEKRLSETAEYASRNEFDAFTTTLLISPYQDHEMIIEIAEKMAKKYNVHFYYRDFRPHFREGQKLAKDAGMYRQKYCGCILSKEYK